MIQHAPRPNKSRGALDSILGSILQRLNAGTVAAYITAAADNEWFLVDHAAAGTGASRPAQTVRPHQELAETLSRASAPINSHTVPYYLFFTRNGARQDYPYTCAWAPVRWEGTLAGGLAVASSSDQSFTTHQLDYLAGMADDLARRLRIRQLITSYHNWGDRSARDQLIHMHLGLVNRACNRFAASGEPIEDLRQVGAMALLTAIDRYRPDQGHDFTAFVNPCITGELLNYLRDHHSLLKIPRSLQRLKVEVDRLTQALVQQLGRDPTVNEVTDHVEAPHQRVREALQLNRNAYPLSLDTELDSHVPVEIAYLLGEEDPTLESACDRISVTDAVAKLDELGKAVIRKKFFEERTQGEIASRLGFSQMHVSRLERKAIARLKEILTEDRDGAQVT